MSAISSAEWFRVQTINYPLCQPESQYFGCQSLTTTEESRGKSFRTKRQQICHIAGDTARGKRGWGKLVEQLERKRGISNITFCKI